MRNLTALFLLSLCSLQLVFSAPTSLDHKGKCCPSVTKAKIPIKNIVSHWWTSSSCTMKAIVFKTIKGKELCVDPTAAWVNSHIKVLDSR